MIKLHKETATREGGRFVWGTARCCRIARSTEVDQPFRFTCLFDSVTAPSPSTG